MNIKTILTKGILIVAVVVFNSCESNTGFADAGQYAKVYMPQALEQPAEYSLVMVDTVQTIIYGAAYGGPGDPQSDIEVLFKVDSSLVDSFNTAMGTSYQLMPESGYELSQASAVIPAGKTSTEPLKLSVTTIGGIQPVVQYLLPISIEVNGDAEVNTDLQTTYFLIEGKFIEFDRQGWTIYDVDSEQADAFPATNILDGNPATFWHTQYSPARPPHPHHVSIDLGETQKINGLRIIGREGFTRGDPSEIMIAVSSDGQNWEYEETFSTTFDVVNENTFYLSKAVNGRYVRITTKSSFMNPGETDLPIVHMAEVYAF